jgi:tetratricopeptide (TPR) repeat protein
LAERELAAPAQRRRDRIAVIEQPPAKESGPPALVGAMAEIDALIRQGNKQDAFDRALAWRTRDAGDVLGIVALGRALEALGKKAEAARVYGSIIDLFPSRADLRRFAAGHLERLQIAAASALALDCLRHAVADRPDHPSGHHLLAMALLKTGQPSAAFAAIESALKVNYPSGRFSGVDRILREDLGLAGAAWARKNPEERGEIDRRINAAGGVQEHGASVRFVLTWETDANDVDFHIHDARGGHAFFSNPHLRSGGDLYADVTTGYGPECFTVREPQKLGAGPYKLQAHYYSKGPMGYGMGRLEIIDHDGQGNLRFETRPFVVMNDGAFLDLGRYGTAKPQLAATGGSVIEKSLN